MALMKALLPLMGTRRKVQIERAIESFNPMGCRKVTDEQVAEIRARLNAKNETHAQIAKSYGIHRSTVSHIKSGRSRNTHGGRSLTG